MYLLPALYFYILVILLKAFEKYFTMFVESERFLSFQSHVSVYSIVLILQDLYAKIWHYSAVITVTNNKSESTPHTLINSLLRIFCKF